MWPVFVAGAVDYTKHSHDLSVGVSSLPVHPDVRFRPLPFYDIMGELLKPTSLGRSFAAAKKWLKPPNETY